MISVTLREIEKSFRRHRHVVNSAGAVSATQRMVLFYAVECGLKAIYMRRNRMGQTGEAVTAFGHRLADLLVALQCAHRLPDGLGKDGKAVASKSLHEAWRYGKELEGQREGKCENAIRNIVQWITNELEGGV